MLAFLIQTILISLSGVMAPGPITAVTIGKGSVSPYAGALVAVGHGIVEFPLMAAVYFGAGYIVDRIQFSVAIYIVFYYISLPNKLRGGKYAIRTEKTGVSSKTRSYYPA